MTSERAEAVEALASIALASASQLRGVLSAMPPPVARRVSRIAAQLETSTVALTAKTPATGTTIRNIDAARSTTCPTCSAAPGSSCTGAQGRQLRSVHRARVEAVRSDERSDQ